MDKINYILSKAKNLAKQTKTWADLSNALFDPFDGEIVKTFTTEDERSKFKKSNAYQQLQILVQNKMKETGLVSGATPKKSGRFVVRLPISLHEALEKEAVHEGTSLNQLVITKLAVQLDNLATDRLSKIIQAFGEIRDGYSVDRVIADPKINKKYLRRCRELGVAGTDCDLNWQLMNYRKRGVLSNLPKTKRYTVRETDDFEYASELAVRYLESKEDVSLDKIICDPELAEEFDKYAALLAPGHTSLEYRWVALGLRKAGRRNQQAQDYKKLANFENIGLTNSLKTNMIPNVGGLYSFLSDGKYVFIGSTDNLKHRIEKHLDVSSKLGLPGWLWDAKTSPLTIEISPLPSISKSIRQGIELEMIRQYNPVLNYKRKVA